MKNAWLTEEIEYIHNNYKLGLKNLCLNLEKHTKRSVQAKCYDLGYKFPTHCWTFERKQKLYEMWPKSSQESLLKEFPECNMHSLQELCRKAKIKRYVTCRKGDLEILLSDDLENYYWMGFFFADGHITKTNQLVIVLAEKDKDHLNKFAEYISGNMTAIKSKLLYKENIIERTSYRVSIQDNLLVEQIKEKYNIPNKKTTTPPKDWSFLKTEKQILAFIAGFIDGDGSILLVNKKYIRLSLSCHETWAESLFELFLLMCEIFNVDSNIIRFSFGKKNDIQFNIGKTSFLKDFLNFLKENNIPFLERKWNKIVSV